MNKSYKLLGLTPEASLKDVEAAYKKLMSRCDPARFALDTDNELMANLICKRLDVAYQQLKNALS